MRGIPPMLAVAFLVACLVGGGMAAANPQSNAFRSLRSIQIELKIAPAVTVPPLNLTNSSTEVFSTLTYVNGDVEIGASSVLITLAPLEVGGGLSITSSSNLSIPLTGSLQVDGSLALDGTGTLGVAYAPQLYTGPITVKGECNLDGHLQLTVYNVTNSTSWLLANCTGISGKFGSASVTTNDLPNCTTISATQQVMGSQLFVLLDVVPDPSCAPPNDLPPAASFLMQSWNGLAMYVWIAMLAVLVLLVLGLGLGIGIWRRRHNKLENRLRRISHSASFASSNSAGSMS